MNTLSRARERRSGFTLMELLIVIVIIGILAGLLMPGYHIVRQRARRTKARFEVQQLEGAFKLMWDEYKKWPVSTDQPVAITKQPQSGGGGSLVDILQGQESSTRRWNVRGIQFFEFKSVSDNSGDPINPWADPRQTPVPPKSLYYVRFDHDFDNTIKKSEQTPPKDVNRPVIVWTEDDGGSIVGSWQ